MKLIGKKTEKFDNVGPTFKEYVKTLFITDGNEVSHKKNYLCFLGRTPSNCCIIQNTSFKTCEGCGQQKVMEKLEKEFF